MKKFLIISLIILLAHASVPFSASANYNQTKDLVVKFNVADPDWSALADLNVVEAKAVFGQTESQELKKFYRLKLATSLGLADLTSRLKSKPQVVWVDVDAKVETALDANDEFYTTNAANTNLQWYLPKIEAAQAWDTRRTSPDITVAIIDTGIDALHQDLNDGRVVAGYKVYCETINDSTCNSRARGEILANTNSDDNSHGTSVASVIGALTNNFAGIAGLTWSVKLMPVKVLNQDGVGTASDVAEGIVWAAQRGAKIINLSLGGAALSDSEILNVAINLAVTEHGAMVVAAAGNDQSSGVDLDTSPSNPVCSDGPNNNVLGVAATDASDQKAVFSNYGSSCIDIAAPGVRILTAYFDPTKPTQQNIYAYRSGTSFAAPLVSATAALVKSQFPNFSPADVKNRIKSMAADISFANSSACGGLPCGSRLGAGRLNVNAALSGIAPAPTPPPPPPPAPTPPPNPTPVFSEGQIIRLAGGSELYIINQNKKRLLIPFVASQRGINTANVAEVTNSQFNAVVSDTPLPPLDGTLIRGDKSLTVFTVDAGLKRGLTYLAFVSNGFSFSRVVVLDEAYVTSLAAGGLYPPKSGSLVRASTELTVYRAEGFSDSGQILAVPVKQPVSYTSFISYGFQFSDVIVVDKNQLAELQTTSLLLPKNGTLLRPSNALTVYVVERTAPGILGALRPLNYTAFVNRGYKFSNVFLISPDEFKLYQEAYGVGQAILQ